MTHDQIPQQWQNIWCRACNNRFTIQAEDIQWEETNRGMRVIHSYYTICTTASCKIRIELYGLSEDLKVVARKRGLASPRQAKEHITPRKKESGPVWLGIIFVFVAEIFGGIIGWTIIPTPAAAIFVGMVCGFIGYRIYF